MLKYLAWDPCVPYISKVRDRQCTYDVTLRGFRSNIVAVEKQYVLYIMSECVCVCILALVIRDVNLIFSAPYYTVICGLSGFI